MVILPPPVLKSTSIACTGALSLPILNPSKSPWQWNGTRLSLSLSLRLKLGFLISGLRRWNRRLMHWQPNPGTALNSQILTEACQCVEGLNGVKDGRWKSSLTFYRPIVRDPSAGLVDHPRDFLGLALQEQPNKYYFILRAHRIVLEADASIQIVMEKLQSYKARIVLNFEVVLFCFLP